MHPKLSKKTLQGFTIFVVTMHALIAKEARPLETLTSRELEAQITEIDATLDTLAHLTLRSGVGNAGWISQPTKEPKPIEWFEIYLEKPAVIDQIILVPVIWRDSEKGFQSDGFPTEFKIIAGTNANNAGVTIAEVSDSSLTPRIAPLIVTLSPTEVTWIRIVATPVRSKVWNNNYTVQFAEVLLFSGEKNVALKQRVKVSSKLGINVLHAITSKALVDGLVPYLMDAAKGEQGIPYITFYRSKLKHSFTIDLEQTQPVDGVNLHAVDILENVPRIHHADYGMPKKLEVTGANKADFSDQKTLVTFERDSLYQTGSILMLRFPEANCRYIRITAIEGYQAPEAKKLMSCFGLAEIEITHNENNVAQGKPIVENRINRTSQGSLEGLTDGRVHFGDILPLKKWLNQLALRHDLEKARPILTAELQARYSQQKRYLKIMYWIAGVLAVVVLLVILIDRIVRMRHIAQLKQRFAADLHDELGANLHSIGLISDLAKDAETVEEWQKLSQRIRDLTERTGTAVRHCTNMLEAKSLYIGLVEDMKRSAKRITTNLTHNIIIEGETYLDKLKPRQRVDLFLFYKESLINICRHSGATAVKTHLSADPKYVTLTIHDNGTGLPTQANSTAPKSLQRRAELLKAQLTVTSNDRNGTSVCLKLRI
jgi:signal transduction histidine kinase